jgi:cation diffusion facilitator CzcD-associated flavoprotein CzcO
MITYLALNRDNVTLEVQQVQRITPTGIMVDGIETEYDLIVLSTGFRTLEFVYPIKISGLGGRDITDIWRSGVHALHGVTVESLPNFAMLYGPNTSVIHNPTTLMIETQSRHINTLIGSEGAADRKRSTYYIGRVVEETNISYRTMGLTAISILTVVGVYLFRVTGSLQVRW